MNAPKSPSMRTPLARVRALGASHSGTSDFWRQRLTAVAMTVLIVPVIVVVLMLIGSNQAFAKQTFSSLPIIFEKGAAFYRDYGMGRSRGTLPFQLAGNVKYGGLVEKAFGLTLRELLYDFGGGSATGRPIRAVQVGGPLGAFIPEQLFDTPLDYEAFAQVEGMIGHGGVVVFDDTVDMAQTARYAMEFCAIESCG